MFAELPIQVETVLAALEFCAAFALGCGLSWALLTDRAHGKRFSPARASLAGLAFALAYRMGTLFAARVMVLAGVPGAEVQRFLSGWVADFGKVALTIALLVVFYTIAIGYERSD